VNDACRALTNEERKAIASLQRLAARWPQSLKLFSWSGSLVVVPAGQSLAEADDPEDLILAQIDGIPNDGGDP
jgi:predicted amidohydrolase